MERINGRRNEAVVIIRTLAIGRMDDGILVRDILCDSADESFGSFRRRVDGDEFKRALGPFAGGRSHA